MTSSLTKRVSVNGCCVLVTGGAGFIGSHLVDKLLAEGARQVVVVDNMFLGNMANLTDALAKGVAFYREDAEFPSSLAYIFEANPIDIVFNCATKALNYSFSNPSNAFSTNTTVVLNLLELQRRGAFRTLCHFSTSEVYGSAAYEPMDEAHPIAPTTAYAAGKAAADLAVQSYVRMFDVDAYIVRPFNNYGPRQNDTGILAGVIPATARRILEGEAPIIFGDGLQCRDFIHVADTVQAVLDCHRMLPAGESANISAENAISICELVSKIAQHFGYKGEILRAPERNADVRCHKATSAKLRGLTGFAPRPFEEGLEQTLNWYMEQRAKVGR